MTDDEGILLADALLCADKSTPVSVGESFDSPIDRNATVSRLASSSPPVPMTALNVELHDTMHGLLSSYSPHRKIPTMAN